MQHDSLEPPAEAGKERLGDGAVGLNASLSGSGRADVGLGEADELSYPQHQRAADPQL